MGSLIIFVKFMRQEAKNYTAPEIRDYEIISKIGQGGIAEIFKARQISLDRHVAVKILFSNLMSDPDIVNRFNLESTTIARLNHPNIVHVIDKGEADGRFYFIMEHVDGTSFKDIITSDRYDIRQKLAIIVMVLKGLDYAHKNGVIHRDIKPANILLDRHGNALVADFGIAHIAGKPTSENTSSDIVMGTIAYMSPEQKTSAANVSPASDIYSVGVMIYEILVGFRPLGRFKLPTEVDPTISSVYDDIIKKCLAQDPNDRFQKAVDLKDAILNALSKESQAVAAVANVEMGVESFIGKGQFLDTLKETKYSSTMLVENKESHELFIIKRSGKSSAGLKEAKLLSSLKHKSIVNIFGAGGDSRSLVIVMEYARGGSLSDRMVKPYPFEQAMEIIIAVADALDFAHKNGIVHGDIRPSNILFSTEEDIKVSDFGFPPHYNLMEKNWYAPPEKRVSKQGDIYSLGVLLHQIVFGKNPIYDRSSHLFLGRTDNIIPHGMRKIMEKLLAIRATQRYRSIEEFLFDWDELQKFLTDSQRPHRAAQPTKEGGQSRKKTALISAVIAAVTLAALLIYFLKFSS
ncbi:MAG: hypothetical protein CVT49_03445 [candidate division Zixibacteria bacterium HGW-Zixibacteria-1]|nr:MAG: hypothetical protein CVT49_03445 [candidate division Zixibacteria bacterium HGW-Zixibacteria-1]